jgi:hypothetical protein
MQWKTKLGTRISKTICNLVGTLFLILIGCITASAFNSPDPVQTATRALASPFNPKDFSWNLDWPGRISRYDLVYLSPPVDPMQGIPLGNGDVSALVWCEGSKIVVVLNKCDLWDDSQTGKPEIWDEKYDFYTTQRQACRIEIDFKYPVFNTLYLTDFKARLSLSDAKLILDGTTPFGHLAFNAFIDHQSGLLLCNLESAFKEDVPIQISVDRFGSRTYSMWYTRMRRDAELGLAGTEAITDDTNVYITQKLTSGTFAVEGSVVKTNGLVVRTTRDHSRLASIQLSGKSEKSVQLAFAVTSPVNGDPVLEVKNKISALQKQDLDSRSLTHSAYWKSIWNRSFVDYGDDYLNNLWYLTMYYAHASQGGKYPGRFNNGLWGWNHDVQQWNFYFHWNQQQLYWPLNAAGFHDLITPYLDYRFHSLRFAKKDAKEVYKADGAFISDVTNRNGYNRIDADVKYNHTPVAEVALDFWRQYQFTNDKKFLKEQALPFILEASRFFQSLLVKESDGLYHAKEGTGYEGVIKLHDGLTELVYTRKLFMVALEALKLAKVDIPEAKIYRDIIDHLAPLPVVKAAQGLIKLDEHGAIINRGIFKGYLAPGNQIIAAGWGIKEKNWLTTWYQTDDPQYAYLLAGDDKTHKPAEFKVLDGIFPAVPWSPVFPSGLVGLKQKGESLFKVMTSTLRLYGTENMGWEPVPIVMARLGLAKELAINLSQFPAKWQFFVNGWGHISPEVEEDAHGTSYFKANSVNVVGSVTGEKVPVPAWPFRHMSMEAMSVLATAMNESMLQSHDGTIRVFPAFNSAKNGRFTLHAQGGFVVSSEMREGKVVWIALKSINGQDCKLELPWDKVFVTSNRNRKSREVRGAIVDLKTKPDEQILLVPNETDVESWSVVGESPSTNEQVKYHESGKTQLGIPRMF